MMQPVLSAAPQSVGARDTRASRRWAGDVAPVIILIALPVLVFGVPALFGHAVLPGDDLTQNFPLRVLAGRQIRNGQLPLFDPYTWSGAPLLADWNAGAAYPLTALFVIMPGVAAWTLNMIVTWAVAGLGMYVFLRALGPARLPSLLGALSFGFAGGMAAQVAHFGLIAGMSWIPVQLLCVLRISQARNAAARLRWTGLLAVALGLTILAGEPRAIDNAGVIVLIYAAWRIARLGRRWGPAAISVAVGVVLGACLGAVQWMPGLAAVGTSQRAASSFALFDSGSLSAKWLVLMLVPDVMGGSGSLGQPSFFSTYNLAEVTGYVGILPLVAAAVLLSRVRLRPRLPEWLVWHVIALVGLLLTLGGKTPLGHVLVHLPLFGDQRLQSRNILVVDLALAVLLAHWADQPFGDEHTGFGMIRARRRFDREMALGLLAPLGTIAVVAVGLIWGAGLLRWLGVRVPVTVIDGRLKPWLVPYAAIAAGAMVFLLIGRRLPKRLRSRWIGTLVAVNLVVFALLGVVAVLPGLGAAPSTPGRVTGSASPILSGQAEGGAGSRPSAPRPISQLRYAGRFAIYDPSQLDAQQLALLGSPDLNVISATPSVQGYSSLVDGRYAAATGSHEAMGYGQNVLDPRAVADGVLDQLDTSALLTLPAYLITSPGAPGPLPGPPGTGARNIAADHRSVWYFATPLDLSRLQVPDPDAIQDAAAGLRIGLLTPGGAMRWFAARAASASLLTVGLRDPVLSVAMEGRAGARPARLGPPSVVAANGSTFVANGQLQNALLPPRWSFAGHDGSFAVFADHFARRPLSLQPLPGRPASGAFVRRVSGSVAAPTAAEISSPYGVRVLRSVAAIPGWTATWNPRVGPTVTLPIGRAGLIQAVDVPPGRGVLTWSYVPPWFTFGLALSLVALALVLLLVTSRQSAAGALRPDRLPEHRRAGQL